MRRFALALLLLGCDPPPPSCPGEVGGPLPTADVVCAHLEAIGCFVEEDPSLSGFDDPSCERGYEDARAVLEEAEFDRVVRCYEAAETCEQVELCNRGCGADGGAIALDAGDGLSRFDADLPDAAVPDAAVPDGGPRVGDAGPDGGTDAGMDAGPDGGADAGMDGGVDAGVDAGPDAGAPDAGVDGGSDTGAPDAGADGGAPDAGT